MENNGLKSESIEPEVQEKLRDLFKYQIFDFYEENGKFYIPFVMSDMAECYLEFEGGSLKGEYRRDLKEFVSGEIVKGETGFGLIVRQGAENTFTLWFQKACVRQSLYQYHQIGHFWVKGEEQWRQIVYMLVTIGEKDMFLKRAVNRKESDLLPLIGFQPLIYWSPLSRNPMSEDNGSSKDAIQAMASLAREAGDHMYERVVKRYRFLPFAFMKKKLAYMLLEPERQPLYQLITKRLKEASLEYGVRDYGEQRNREIREIRTEAQAKLKQAGFQGVYPDFQKENVQIYIAEQHPFTVMESKDFVFCLKYMVSICPGNKTGRNSGFFKGSERESHIFNEEELWNWMKQRSE